MSITSLNDHKNSDGSTNWASYDAAQIQSGEKCLNCGTYIVFAKGYPSSCVECARLSTPGEVRHGSLIRCPECLRTFSPDTEYDRDLFDEGEHLIRCHHCEHEFEVAVTIEYTYTSPPLNNTAKNESDE